ncbi:MAG: DUF2252 family protein, partial [Paucibacter sp.]|nr:DUF2252 family protein [Roseateles sp.]
PYFDLNDFDEAALAPATWELVRLLTSLWAGAQSLGADEAECVTLCQAYVEAYADALASGKAYWLEPQTAHGPIGSLLNSLRDRQRVDFLNSRSVLKRRTRQLKLDGKHALPVTAAQRSQVETFMVHFAAAQPDPAFYEVLDVARRIAGTGSLGLDRYVMLVRGKGSPDGNYLLDLKQAAPSSLVPHLKVEQPRWKSEAHRVVSLQRRMQAVSMAFLQPVMLGQRGFILRGLQPSEDRVTLDRAHRSAEGLKSVLTTMGRLTAWAQLRSSGREGSAIADELIDFGHRRKWRAKLLDAARDCAKQLDADATCFAQAYDDGVFNV